MGSVYKKSFTKPLPTGAETFRRDGEQYARWKDAKGKARTARVTTGKDGTPRLLIQASTYTAHYRDGADSVREVATGCKDKSSALAVLHEHEQRAEKVRAGIMSAADSDAADAACTPIGEHIEAYVENLRLRGAGAGYCDTSKHYLDTVFGACGVQTLRDIQRDDVEQYLLAEVRDHGRSYATHNATKKALVAFSNWCVRTRRLSAQVLVGLPTLNAREDPRRRRRALTPEEFGRLLRATERTPGLCGLQRRTLYILLTYTGLRLGEAASLRRCDIDLDCPRPKLTLEAKNEKSKRGATIFLRANVVDALREWFKARPMTPEAKVFNPGSKLLNPFDADLKAAGIPKRDVRDRTVDLHALRTTFCSWLAAAGVPLRTAQELMRHADPKLTAMVYTDTALLDVDGALAALPDTNIAEGSLATVLAIANGPRWREASFSGSSPAPTGAAQFTGQTAEEANDDSLFSDVAGRDTPGGNECSNAVNLAHLSRGSRAFILGPCLWLSR